VVLLEMRVLLEMLVLEILVILDLREELDLVAVVVLLATIMVFITPVATDVGRVATIAIHMVPIMAILGAMAMQLEMRLAVVVEAMVDTSMMLAGMADATTIITTKEATIHKALVGSTGVLLAVWVVAMAAMVEVHRVDIMALLVMLEVLVQEERVVLEIQVRPQRQVHHPV
jgi:hypothetical protein